MTSWYTGQIYRGVDYSPTWPGWTVGANATQTGDSDFANDAFASLWANGYQAAPAGSPSVPFNNGGDYRADLQTIANDGFNLVRLYNWDMARGTSATSGTGLDHLNFLNYANSLGLKIVVPVSDFFLNDTEFSWNGATPDKNYSFASAPAAIQTDFKQFIASITDPTTGKISTAVQSISIGNEGDIGEGLQESHTSASDFLARTNWWIYNLHQQINGTASTGPDGNPVVNGPSSIVPISATFANADQGTGISSWFMALLSGVQAGQATPNHWVPTNSDTFTAQVTGLAAADPGFESYYYNSFNIGQSTTTPPFGNGIDATLALYDSGASPWPGAKFNVPVLLMEVFTPNRSLYPTPTDQALASVNEAKDIEAYLAANHAGTPDSTTNLMGYNYFQFNDEPAANKMVGLYQYSDASQNAQTGTTSVFYGTFPNSTFPVYKLTATPDGQGTLAAAWTANFPTVLNGTDGPDTFNIPPHTNYIINGKSQQDIIISSEAGKNFAVETTVGGSTITLQDKVGTDGTGSLISIENIQFSDMTLNAASITKTAAMPVEQILTVVDLYTAGLNRAPDAVGLQFWASQLADGDSIGNISKVFFSALEAAPIYSPNNSNTEFVSLEYQTALGRAPDALGAAFWLNELQTGHIQRTDFVTALIAGARAPSGSAADAQYIANHEAVGGHFSLTQGLNNVAWAVTVESAVNGTMASVTAANAQTDAFAATAATAAGTELVVQIVGVVP